MPSQLALDGFAGRIAQTIAHSVRIPAIVTAGSKFIVTDKLLMLEGSFIVV